jgi:hypothetical protein
MQVSAFRISVARARNMPSETRQALFDNLFLKFGMAMRLMSDQGS